MAVGVLSAMKIDSLVAKNIIYAPRFSMFFEKSCKNARRVFIGWECFLTRCFIRRSLIDGETVNDSDQKAFVLPKHGIVILRFFPKHRSVFIDSSVIEIAVKPRTALHSPAVLVAACCLNDVTRTGSEREYPLNYRVYRAEDRKIWQENPRGLPILLRSPTGWIIAKAEICRGSLFIIILPGRK